MLTGNNYIIIIILTRKDMNTLTSHVKVKHIPAKTKADVPSPKLEDSVYVKPTTKTNLLLQSALGVKKILMKIAVSCAEHMSPRVQ